MSQEFEDPRKELLEDLLQWLEWQAVCGGDVWLLKTLHNMESDAYPRPNASVEGASWYFNGKAKPSFLKFYTNEGKIQTDNGFSQHFLYQIFTTRIQRYSERGTSPNTSRSFQRNQKELLASAFDSFLEARPQY